MGFGKVFSESIGVTEVISLGVGKPLIDSLSITDSVIISPVGKNLGESLSVTDSGSLRSQGYCDFTYFAGDYVGASATF